MSNDVISKNQLAAYKPTGAYVGTSWAVMLVGVLAYLLGLWNATGMLLNEKGYYLAVLILGLYSAISLQKTLRDRAEGIPTTQLYYSISWAALAVSIALILIGLINADGLNISEKGFYLMSFTISIFAAVTIQKNTRDLVQIQALTESSTTAGEDNGNKRIDTNHAEQKDSAFDLIKPQTDSKN